MENQTNKICCEHNERGEISNICKLSEGCIYSTDFQEDYNGLKFCIVAGIVDPKEISSKKREQLNPSQLETKIYTAVSSV